MKKDSIQREIQKRFFSERERQTEKICCLVTCFFKLQEILRKAKEFHKKERERESYYDSAATLLVVNFKLFTLVRQAKRTVFKVSTQRRSHFKDF